MDGLCQPLLQAGLLDRLEVVAANALCRGEKRGDRRLLRTTEQSGQPIDVADDMELGDLCRVVGASRFCVDAVEHGAPAVGARWIAPSARDIESGQEAAS